MPESPAAKDLGSRDLIERASLAEHRRVRRIALPKRMESSPLARNPASAQQSNDPACIHLDAVGGTLRGELKHQGGRRTDRIRF